MFILKEDAIDRRFGALIYSSSTYYIDNYYHCVSKK